MLTQNIVRLNRTVKAPINFSPMGAKKIQKNLIQHYAYFTTTKTIEDAMIAK